MELKYKYTYDSKIVYDSIELPDYSKLFVGKDWEDNDVYEDDILVSRTNYKKVCIAKLKPKVIGREQYWSEQDFKAAVEYNHLLSQDTRKTTNTTIWQGRKLDGDLVSGELDFRRNDFNPDKYDCFILDQNGPHLVDLESLIRIK